MSDCKERLADYVVFRSSPNLCGERITAHKGKSICMVGTFIMFRRYFTGNSEASGENKYTAICPSTWAYLGITVRLNIIYYWKYQMILIIIKLSVKVFQNACAKNVYQ